jgi:hypothetical protein
MEEDAEVEDIFNKKPKKIKSGKKGKRVELELVKNLNHRFQKILASNPDLGSFSRSIGSGNRWGQHVHLSKNASNTYSGDIVCPDNFKFVLESKGGYNDIDLCSVFGGGQSELDGFLDQVTSDSERCGRKPLLLWKKDRKPRLAFLKAKDLPPMELKCSMKYKDWIVVNYDDLMSLDDGFFFS